ncbi:Fic family protein [Curtobacterium sp. S6]|uniref:Fic family protein n=1 Tax=Curtobacterium sp. S6 TaxID=1479623 RepID=UPI0004AA728D|nr:Fic family protein [Curtobacterium sp. S6]
MSQLSWPALSFREQQWFHRDPMSSRRATRRNTGTFRAAVVPHIRDLTPSVSAELQAATVRMSDRLRDFDRESRHLDSLPFAAILLRGESVSSSQIENITVRARKLSLATLGVSSAPNANLVARNVRAMQAALAASDHLTTESILAMHRELTEGIPGDSGMLRREWVWIAGESPVTADHVGPHWDDLPDLMRDLVAFMDRRDIDPLVQAAIAHAQFEIIHPFTDGNGRTGRALVSSLLRARGVTQHVTVPLSSGLLHGKSRYVEALTDYRSGTLESIVSCFVSACESALASTAILHADVAAFHREVLASRQRVTRSLRAIADLCCAEPAFTGRMVEDLAHVSKPTAYRTVQELVERGLLREENAKVSGSTVWTAPRILRALDDFAERAGRRASE